MSVSIGPKIGIDGEREYRNQIKNIIQETKTLDKQMGALESSFDDATDEMKKHEKALDLLEQKQAALTEGVEKMRDMVEQASEKYGEGATETLKWEAALADAEKALNETNTEIENQQKAIEELNSPLGQLTQEISDQQSELEALKDEYVDAFLAGDTERCNELAGEIENLSGSLRDNQQAMADAKAEADGFDQTIDKVDEVADAEGKVADGSEKMAGAFGGSMMSMAESIATGNVADLVGEIVDKVMDLAESAVEVQAKFEDAGATVAYGTGLTGEALEELQGHAENAWAAVADKNASVDDFSAIIANLNTRLGLTGDEAEAATVVFGKFSKVTGENGAKAVNQVVDTMKKWGMVTGDAETDIATMTTMLEEMTVAVQSTDASSSEYLSNLAKQSQTFDALGLSMEDTLALMMEYEDAGGAVSDFSTATTKALSKLSEETDDVGGSFQTMMDMMRQSGDASEIMQQQIGDTGLTIEDVFGQRRAQQIIGTFQAMNQSTNDWSGSLQNAAGSLGSTYDASLTAEDGVSLIMNSVEKATGLNSDFLKSAAMMTGSYQLIATAGQALASTTTDSFKSMDKSGQANVKETDANAKKTVATANSMASGTKAAYNNAATSMGTATGNMSSSAESMNRRTSAAYGNAAAAANSACGSMVNSARWASANSNIWVSAHGSLPIIRSSKGDTVLSYNVAGYTRFARGYDEAMILNSPTLFGLIGGDRPGNEVVVGESHLLDMIGKTIQTAFGYVPAAAGNTTTTNNRYEGSTINVYGAPGQDVRELANIIEQKISRNVNRRAAAW